MHFNPQFRPDLAPYEAFAASLRVWLVDLLGALAKAGARSDTQRLVAQCTPRIRTNLRTAAVDLHRVLFLKAFVRLNLRFGAKQTQRPANAPHGFRLQRTPCGLRALLGSTLRELNAGSLQQRAERQREIIDNPEPLIARIVARLMRVIGRMRSSGLVLVTSPRELVEVMVVLAPSVADTS